MMRRYSPIKLISLLRYSLKTVSGKLWKRLQHTQTSTGQLSVKLYVRISDLPLRNFIRCIVDGDFTALVISGYATLEDLVKAWRLILLEYVDAITDGDERMELTLHAEYMELKITYQCVIDAIEILSEYYVADLVPVLNKLLRVKYNPDPSKQKEYYDTLTLYYNNSLDLSLELRIKEKQLKAIQTKQATGEYTHEYFQSHLITLSDYAKYRITDDISTYEYCNRINRLLKHNKEVERINAKQNAA